MAKKKSKPFRIDTGQEDRPPFIAAGAKPAPKDVKAGVNLRYFQKSFECFSAWQKNDLKSFSNFIEKMSQKTEAQITSVTKTCHAHRGSQRRLPKEVSPDVKMYSLDVSPAGRVHGFFIQGSFYLVWLDRKGNLLGH